MLACSYSRKFPLSLPHLLPLPPHLPPHRLIRFYSAYPPSGILAPLGGFQSRKSSWQHSNEGSPCRDLGCRGWPHRSRRSCRRHTPRGTLSSFGCLPLLLHLLGSFLCVFCCGLAFLPC